MKKIILSFALLLLSPLSLALEKSENVRIHVMNCGHMQVDNMTNFSDTGEYDGQSGSLDDPCFLIQHPKGLLLWDTGLGDNLIANPAPKDHPYHPTVSVSLKSQLEKLGVSPKDITFLAFSHIHMDHTGNANQFLDSTWLWQEKEWDYAHSKDPGGVVLKTFDQFEKVKKKVIKGDYDVFGDGRVKILMTTGHTPGHQALLVKLKNKPVILSGDLYHLIANREQKRVPTFNVDRADTLASFDRIETIAKNLNARVIIQHDPEEYVSLPKFPQFLE